MTTISMKFAPIHSVEWLKNGVWGDPGRDLYRRGGLEFLPDRDSVPLVIDHDMSRRVGTVDMMYHGDWIEGPWYFARAQVDDPPVWLERHTPVSFSHWNVFSFPNGEHERVHSAYVKEISILPPGVEPAEPLAHVLSVDRTSATRITREPGLNPGDVVIYGNGQRVRRYFADAQITVR